MARIFWFHHLYKRVPQKAVMLFCFFTPGNLILMFAGSKFRMAAYLVDFNPRIHQKVRHNDQLYVVFLEEYDLLRLPPDANVVIHFISDNKILFHEETCIQQLYTVRKRDLIIVTAHTES